MKTYIIAEIGPNHNGKCAIAFELIEKCAEAGVNAVKFQISIPENSYSADSFRPKYQKRYSKTKSALEMSVCHQLSFDDHVRIYEKAKAYGLDYICSAFEIESLKFIDQNFEMPFYKIPSGEVFSLDLIEYMACSKRPIVMSTGMCTFKDVNTSIHLLKQNGLNEITLLHCISNYPTPIDDVNLRVIPELHRRFELPVGFSDHTIGLSASLAAVALGARMIEKHVTLRRDMPGPDHQASSTVEELAELVKQIDSVERALGTNSRVFSNEELEIRKAVRKSIVSCRSIKKGETIGKKDVCFKRPGTGYLPTQSHLVVGKVASVDIPPNRVILKEYLS